MITQELVQEWLNYDPETGFLTWRKRPGARAKLGVPAGWVGATGHRYIKVCGTETTVSRIIWLHVYGFLPEVTVDHLNGDHLDCRLSNLELYFDRKGQEVTQKRLKTLFEYDPETGLFKRRIKSGKCGQVGNTVGWKNDQGYILIPVNGKTYRAHRLAWLYVHGKWPEKDIDHANGNPSDNRISNLREAEDYQNLGNAKKPITNTSGLKGASWHAATQSWQVHIRFDGENFYLGHYATKEEAHAVYCEAALRLRKEFARFD